MDLEQEFFNSLTKKELDEIVTPYERKFSFHIMIGKPDGYPIIKDIAFNDTFFDKDVFLILMKQSIAENKDLLKNFIKKHEIEYEEGTIL